MTTQWLLCRCSLRECWGENNDIKKCEKITRDFSQGTGSLSFPKCKRVISRISIRDRGLKRLQLLRNRLSFANMKMCCFTMLRNPSCDEKNIKMIWIEASIRYKCGICGHGIKPDLSDAHASLGNPNSEELDERQAKARCALSNWCQCWAVQW